MKMKMRSNRRWATVLITSLAIAIVFTCNPVSAADNAEQFFKGKKITVIIPYSVGGGYDFYARLVGKYMEKYIPDSVFVPLNITGAGGLLGSNRLYASKPDGLTIGLTNTGGLVFNQIMGGEGVSFDLNKFGWIGRITADQHVFVINSKLPYNTLMDVKKSGKLLKLGFNGVGSDDYFAVSVIMHTMEIPYDMVTGYEGQKESVMGVLRGEVDGTAGTITTMLPQIKAGDFKAVVKFGAESGLLPANVEDVIDLVEGEKKALVQAIGAIFTLDRSIAAPPGVPAERLAYLRSIFDKAMQDPALHQEAEKSKRPLSYLAGKDLIPKMEEALKAGSTLKPILQKSLEIGKR